MNGHRISNSWKSGTIIPAVFLGLAFAHPVAAQVYTVANLGTLGGDSSGASAINNSGQVVGASLTSSGATHGFLFAGGAMTDLGTLPGGTASSAAGINDAGQVVGVSGINEYGPQFSEVRQGFIWEGGTLRPLGALFCPCSFNQRYGTSAAFAINAGGQIVGDSRTVRGESIRHAFVWQSSAMQDIGGGAGSLAVSYAYGINGTGQVAGALDQRATLWQAGAPLDLGTLPGHTASTARGINAAGEVVGESVGGLGQLRAFLWKSGAMQDLGVLPGDASSQANGINAAGRVVGWSGSAAGSGSRAFLWQNGAMVDLNGLLPAGSGWILTNATAINDRGEIVGVGVLNGRTRAFLMAPTAPIALLSAILPSSRSVQVGVTATAFATIINSGSDAATACRISMTMPIPVTFTYQTTDVLTNAVTGSADTPVNIPGGQRQSFVIALTARAPILPTDVPFGFACANSAPALISPGVNTLVFSASPGPVPDIRALTATPSNDGIVTVPLGGTGVFAVATVNLGADGTISVATDTGQATVPLGISICRTDDAGRCLSALGSTDTAVGSGDMPTFAVFVTATGAIRFDPAANRVFVRFRDASGVLRGSTSVAVRTD